MTMFTVLTQSLAGLAVKREREYSEALALFFRDRAMLAELGVPFTMQVVNGKGQVIESIVSD